MTNNPWHLGSFNCTCCNVSVDTTQKGAVVGAIDGDWSKPVCDACWQKHRAAWLAGESSARTDMTIRERFAMAAMQGIAGNTSYDWVKPDDMAADAVRIADALLAELAKGER